MTIRARVCAAAALAALVVPAAAASAGTAGRMTLTPVGRLPFPERGYVIDVPHGVPATGLRAAVRENGHRVRGATLTPVGATDVSFGTILAVDASDSMSGEPSTDALAAARTFVERRNANLQVGIVAFNGAIHVLQRPTSDGAALAHALARPPALSYGTRISDALLRSLVLLERAHISSGSIVLLSDGADIGSRSRIDTVLARAVRDHVRVFTVGLRSGAFDAASLARIADGTNGSYGEASIPSQLAPLYTTLGERLSSEYLLEYRSTARPGAQVSLTVDVAGVGTATTAYAAPTPSRLAPFHQSLASRFVLSGGALALLVLLVIGLLAWALTTVLRRTSTPLVARLGAFVAIDGSTRARGSGRTRRRLSPGSRRRSGALDRRRATLAGQFELARISLPPDAYVAATAAATVLTLLALAVIALPLCLLAILVPLAARGWVTRKVDAVRAAFADQLPDTLQLLASALRSGHSFSGALSVVIEEAAEPSRREFRQVLADDQLGIPIEESLRRVALRMASREMEQVALLGELQRIAGGNSAEVLDTVVETIRERTDLRRLARTLTAQGRMARWILSLLPGALTVFLWFTQPQLIRPLFENSAGQAALVICGLMVVAGAMWIKRIVEIKV